MDGEFTTLITLLASISMISWIAVAATTLMRYAARARYFRRAPKVAVHSAGADPGSNS